MARKCEHWHQVARSVLTGSESSSIVRVAEPVGVQARLRLYVYPTEARLHGVQWEYSTGQLASRQDDLKVTDVRVDVVIRTL